MLFVTVEFDFVIQADDFAIHPRAHEPGLADFLEDGLVGSLTRAHHRREDQDARAFVESFDGLHNFLGRLFDHLASADRAVRRADAGVQQPEIIVYLGYGTHRRARVVGGRFLVDGYCRGESLNVVHIRFIHLPDELARVGRERLDIAALALGEDGIEGQGGFAGAGQPGNDDEFIAGNLDRDVFQVMLAGAHHADDVLRHSASIQGIGKSNVNYSTNVLFTDTKTQNKIIPSRVDETQSQVRFDVVGKFSTL